MNQNRNHTSVKSLLNRHPLLANGIGWLSGMSVLSAGMVFAQASPVLNNAATPTGTDNIVPSAQDLLQSELPSSASTLQIPTIDAPAAIAQPEEAVTSPAAVPSTDAPVVVETEPAAPTAVVPLSTPSSPKAADSNSTITPPSISDNPTNAASSTSSPLVAPNLTQSAEAAFGKPTTGSYIDPTPYDLGATSKPDIVVAERSSGCQLILQPGQEVPTSVCPPKPADANVASGAIGSSSGYSATPGNYDPSSLSVYNLDAAVASARDFYNLTVRPPARLSNGNINLLFPLSIPAAITSAFGWRMHPVMGEMRFHSGTDIGAPEGTPVMAAFSGKVDVADFVGGYGLAVVLLHNKGTEQTLYGHMSEIFVKPGDEVKQGEVIGRVGSTGLSTGPHLHFEFRKLTQEGWVVMDAGGALEYALAQLVHSLQVAQSNPKTTMPALFKSSGKALQLASKVQPKAQAKAEQKNQPQTQPVSQLNSREMRED